ncbi:hypothetical protein K7432_015655 [Basidiobolus ranarum]|uniref:Uncharacterized protein n=1 Tax=Basidiobolus ranarum TaxID=34480 RepID=A0ABR2VMS3_9FUNG
MVVSESDNWLNAYTAGEFKAKKVIETISAEKAYAPSQVYGRVWECLLDTDLDNPGPCSIVADLHLLAKNYDSILEPATTDTGCSILNKAKEEGSRMFNDAFESYGNEIVIQMQEMWCSTLDSMAEYKLHKTWNGDLRGYLKDRVTNSMMYLAYMQTLVLRKQEYTKSDDSVAQFLSGIVALLHDCYALLRVSDKNDGKNVLDHVEDNVDPAVVLLHIQTVVGRINESSLDRIHNRVFKDFINAHTTAALTHSWYGLQKEIIETVTGEVRHSVKTELTIEKSVQVLREWVATFESYCTPCPEQDVIKRAIDEAAEIVHKLLKHESTSFRKNASEWAQYVYHETLLEYNSRPHDVGVSPYFGIYYAMTVLPGDVASTDAVDVSMIFAELLHAEAARNKNRSSETMIEVSGRIGEEAIDRIALRNKWLPEVKESVNCSYRDCLNKRKLTEVRDMAAEALPESTKRKNYISDKYYEYIEQRVVEGFWIFTEVLINALCRSNIPRSLLGMGAIGEAGVILFETLSLKRRLQEDGGASIHNLYPTQGKEGVRELYARACGIMLVNGYGNCMRSSNCAGRVYAASVSSAELCMAGSVTRAMLDNKLPN